MNIAMIGLMREARLRVSEAAALAGSYDRRLRPIATYGCWFVMPRIKIIRDRNAGAGLPGTGQGRSPRANGALTTQPGAQVVPSVRNTSASSMQSPSVRAEATSFISLSAVSTTTKQGKPIMVTVTFTHDANNEESLTSAATDAVEALPDKPQSLAGEATAQEIKLTWTAPTGDTVVEYVVYRGTLQNGSMNGQALSKYATIDAAGKAMTHTDDNVEEGVEYAVAEQYSHQRPMGLCCRRVGNVEGAIAHLPARHLSD